MYNNHDLRSEYYNYVNNNYNQPTFTENANPSKLYDPYQGFIRGNMFKSLYNDYKLKNTVELQAMTDKEQLLLMLDALGFAMVDISLYLTIYPNDRDMTELYNQYRQQEKAVCDQYEKMYGPLTTDSEVLSKGWTWNSSPWPWEK